MVRAALVALVEPHQLGVVEGREDVAVHGQEGLVEVVDLASAPAVPSGCVLPAVAQLELRSGSSILSR